MSAEDYFYPDDDFGGRADEPREEQVSKIVRETLKAYLFENDGGRRWWCPKSICEVHHGYVVIPEWFDVRYCE